MKAVNNVGEAVCTADFEIRPPPPQGQHQDQNFPPPRPPSPVSLQNSSRNIVQSKESTTLQTLADFKHTDKPLPELAPFPFVPEKGVERPKSCGTVPTPSKFIKGTMYYSDYESDLEGPIPTKWRSYCSDTEDGNRIQKYRKVKPKLVRKTENVPYDRKPSPPCPHKWESHETIEKLEEQLRNKKSNFLEQVALLKSSKVKTKLETTSIITQESTKMSKTFSGGSMIGNQNKSMSPIVDGQSKKDVTDNTEFPKINSNTTKTTTTHQTTTFSTTNNICNEEKKTTSSSTITNQKNVASNDKAPEFEAVNFQTYENQDGTKHHVLDICDIKASRDQTVEQVESVGDETKSLTLPIETVKIPKIEENVEKRQEITETNKSTTEMNSSRTSNIIKNIEKSAATTHIQPLSIISPSPPPPLPAKTRYSAITPSQSSSSQQTMVSNIMDNTSSISDDHSHSSQSTVRCVVREEFVSVKEKIKFLEQKVEEQDNIESELEHETTFDEKPSNGSLPQIDRQTPTTPTTPKIKPHEIPGAVRILPPAASSPLSFRFGSSSLKRARRSNSMEQYNSMCKSSPNSSPLTLPRSAQPSPLNGMSPFFRKLSMEYSNTQFDTNKENHARNIENDNSNSSIQIRNDINAGTHLGLNETGTEKLKTFKEKLINEKMLSPSPPVIANPILQKDDKNAPNTDMNAPPRPPLPSEVTDYALTQSSSGEQLHTTYRYSDTEFASSSMTELAYSSTSMERPAKTNLDKNDCTGRHLEPSESLDLSDGNVFSITRKSKFHHATNNIPHGDKVEGEREGFTESELESDPIHIIKDDMFARKRQNRSPRQNTPTLEQKQSPKLNRASARSSRKESSKLDMDGYEADTDDTLSRQKRRSVKDLAKTFQEAENACPSPQPFKPKPNFMHDASDYEASDFEYQPRLIFIYYYQSEFNPNNDLIMIVTISNMFSNIDLD